MLSVETRLRVRYAETDQMGVAYHANYLVWMEVGRVEFCRASGVVYKEMEREDGILLAVAEAGCRFIAPARYDDEVIVRTTLPEANPRLIRFHYEMLESTSGRLLATGFTRHIFLNREMRPTKLPEKYRPAFGLKPKAES